MSAEDQANLGGGDENQQAILPFFNPTYAVLPPQIATHVRNYIFQSKFELRSYKDLSKIEKEQRKEERAKLLSEINQILASGEYGNNSRVDTGPVNWIRIQKSRLAKFIDNVRCDHKRKYRIF